MNLLKKTLSLNGIASLNPMQKKAWEKGLFEGNLVVSSPTASGKTLLAELAALNSIINRKKKVLYSCPLRALASEHFQGFKKKYAQTLDIKPTISTGDFDSGSRHLQNYDAIFSTYEKIDSLLRHKTQWLSNIGLLVIDEIHTIDSSRGPVIEMIAAKLRLMNPKLQVLALSATIPNAKELASWLDAKLVQSSYRPVKLREGIFFSEELHFPDSIQTLASSGEPLPDLVSDTLQKQKQALVFLNTRRNSMGAAKKLAPVTRKTLSPKEKDFLLKKSAEVLNALESPTEQCKTLSALVKDGVAFHNAGLVSKQRTIIEELFRSGHLKIVASTTTLGAGINMPAFRVLIPSLYRFTAFGQQRIPVREYKQLAGRSGRPGYDLAGESIIFARSEPELEELKEDYINGELEDVVSNMGSSSVLRVHVLASIASDFVFDLSSLEKFFSHTFYFHQFKDKQVLLEKVQSVLSELREMGFIAMDEKRFKATPLGKRVSELYLDPLSGHEIAKAIRANKFNDLAFLFLLSSLSELMPLPSVSKARQADLWEKIQECETQLPVNVEEEMFSDQLLLQKFNSSLLLVDWVSEVREDEIAKTFKVLPGILQAKLRIVDWLAYSCFELAKLLNEKELLPFFARMRKRLKYGVKEELLLLTELRGIGRVRARRLFRAGIKKFVDLKKTSLKDLSTVLGPATAIKVKQQLGQEISAKQKAEAKNSPKKGQTALNNF